MGKKEQKIDSDKVNSEKYWKDIGRHWKKIGLVDAANEPIQLWKKLQDVEIRYQLEFILTKLMDPNIAYFSIYVFLNPVYNKESNRFEEQYAEFVKDKTFKSVDARTKNTKIKEKALSKSANWVRGTGSKTLGQNRFVSRSPSSSRQGQYELHPTYPLYYLIKSLIENTFGGISKFVRYYGVTNPIMLFVTKNKFDPLTNDKKISLVQLSKKSEKCEIPQLQGKYVPLAREHETSDKSNKDKIIEDVKKMIIDFAKGDFDVEEINSKALLEFPPYFNSERHATLVQISSGRKELDEKINEFFRNVECCRQVFPKYIQPEFVKLFSFKEILDSHTDDKIYDRLLYYILKLYSKYHKSLPTSGKKKELGKEIENIEEELRKKLGSYYDVLEKLNKENIEELKIYDK